MYSIQTKIGTYLKNKSVHDLNEDKKTKKNGCKQTDFNMKYLPIIPIIYTYLNIHFPTRPKKLF